MATNQSPPERFFLATDIHINGRPTGIFSGPVGEERPYNLPDFSGMPVSYIVPPNITPDNIIPDPVQESEEFLDR